jgi:acyl-coenzyme A synthetase/AMP-(fatty) acid ligase
MMKSSNRCANYFLSLGIQKGDKVMLVLKRHYQFWFAMLALHKIGAVAIPATYQLVAHDFSYRYQPRTFRHRLHCGRRRCRTGGAWRGRLHAS